MANLYITEQNSIIRKTGDRLIVQKDNVVLLDIQCHKIDTILIFGNVQFTTQSVHELFEHGIELALLTRTGRLVGQLTPPMPKNIEIRMAQYERYKDEDFVLKLSKAIVSGKLKNSMEVLRRFSYNHPEVNLKDETGSLEKSIQEVQFRNNLQELRGIEGAGAKVYFGGFAKMIRGDFDFNGRKKRPAPDPVNALLSFGYTILFNEISSLLDGIGFDPYLGFFHQIEYGRSSLAADLIEEFRAPVVDRFTLKLINDRIFVPEDFSIHPPSGSMHLNAEKMKRYFAEYEKYMNQESKAKDLHFGSNTLECTSSDLSDYSQPQILGDSIQQENTEKITFRKSFREQAHRLAKAIKNEEEYIPFHLVRGMVE